MSIYLTSDWHFNHNKPFVWEVRDFSNVQEMNEAIIERHNSIVKENDTVYVLGDCALGGGDPEVLAANKSLIERLSGELFIIRGNHCTDKRVEMYASCKNVISANSYSTMIKYQKYHFYLSHFPTITENFGEEKNLKQCIINLYGHTHQKSNFYKDCPYMYHVGVDSHDCYPVLLDNIIEEIKEKLV